jgi:heme oxygenase (mycobilin-producing)
MYVSLSRLRIAVDRADELVRAFRARTRLGDHADGFIDLEVLAVGPRRRRADHGLALARPRRVHGYMRSEDHKTSHARIPKALDDEIKLEGLERYGDAARAWELHDTQHLLHWAIGDVEGYVEMNHQVDWLARVLAARDFPLEHLAVNLELAADVVGSAVARGGEIAQRLVAAAAAVRAQ